MAVLLIDCIPDSLEVESDDDGYVVTVPALENVDGDKFVTLDVRLSPLPAYSDDYFEFSFGFTVADWDENELSYFTQDRYEVERYFNGNSRDYVLPTLCACIEALIDHVQPGYIYRVTKGRNLPHKALAKHLLVTETLIGLGYYEVESGTDQFNRTFCTMSR